MFHKPLQVALLAAFAVVMGSLEAFAAQPLPWGMHFQDAATPIMERVAAFNDLLLVVILAIGLFVLFLLIYVVLRFRRSVNPTPSKNTHNTFLEVAWTVIPIIILVIIAIPSFKLLYFIDKVPESEITLKITGHQWYWSYEYADQGIRFDALMIPDDKIDKSKGQLRMLETDNRIVLPVRTNVRLLMTAEDVIHAWAVPAFGIKYDTVPGHLAEGWVHVNREGVYYGQCSELCGAQHSKMPITVEVVSKQKFAAWLEEAKKKFAVAPEPTTGTKLAADFKPVEAR